MTATQTIEQTLDRVSSMVIPGQDETARVAMKNYVDEVYRSRIAAGDTEEEAATLAQQVYWGTGNIASAGVGSHEANLYCANGVHLYFYGVHLSPNAAAFFGAGPGVLFVDPERIAGQEARYAFTVLPSIWPLMAANVTYTSPDFIMWGNWTPLGTGTPSGPVPGAGTGTFKRIA